jgi:hypothetical protein
MTLLELDPEVWDRVGCWPLRKGGGGDNQFGWRSAWLGKAGCAPFWSMEIALKMRTITENFSQGSQVAGGYSLRRLGRLLGTASAGLPSISPPRIPVGGFSQPLDKTGAFLVAELRGSPHQLNLIRNCQMWSANKGIHEISWICRLVTYQGALAAMRRHLYCKTSSFRTWLRSAYLRIGHS